MVRLPKPARVPGVTGAATPDLDPGRISARVCVCVCEGRWVLEKFGIERKHRNPPKELGRSELTETRHIIVQIPQAQAQ